MASVPEVGLTITGVTGRLVSGCRLVATLWAWEARSLPGHRRLAVTVAHAHRDPIWWDQHTQPLTVALDVGNRVWRGTATIERDEPGSPLALTMEEVDIV